MPLLTSVDPLTLTVWVLLLSVVLLAIAYPDRFITTRALHGLPGPRGAPILGNALQIIPWQGRTLDWLKHLIDTYGPLCTFTLPLYGRGILINRPEWLAHIKQHDIQWYSRGSQELAILSEFPGQRTPIFCEGADWRKLRKALLPIFTVNAFTEHVSHAMVQTIPEVCALLTHASKTGVAIDWNNVAGRMTLTLFTRSSMGLDLGLIRPDVKSLQQMDPFCYAIALLSQISSRRLMNPFWRWTEILTGDRTRFVQARHRVRSLVETIISTRKAEMVTAPDELTHNWLSAMLKDASLDEPALIQDVLVVLLFAGSDNTQNSFAWSLYSLLGAPEWIDRLRAEALANKATMGDIKYADLSHYHVHLAVFYETIRLWPGIPKNGRLAVHDDVLPELPEHGLPAVKIEKGDFVFWSDYHMMRSEMVWGPTANRFDPGRHLDDNGLFIRPTAPNFNGFGGGPRFCPAAQLVAYEYVTCMAGILPHFDFTPITHDPATGGKIEPPQMAEAFTPAMARPFMVHVQAREDVVD